jgi:hypothetical protein
MRVPDSWWKPGATREQARRDVIEFAWAMVLIPVVIAVLAVAVWGATWLIHEVFVTAVRNACRGGNCK